MMVTLLVEILYARPHEVLYVLLLAVIRNKLSFIQGPQNIPMETVAKLLISLLKNWFIPGTFPRVLSWSHFCRTVIRHDAVSMRCAQQIPSLGGHARYLFFQVSDVDIF